MRLRRVGRRLGRIAGLALLALATPSYAAAQDGSSLLLKDGFDAGRFASEGGLYYKDNAEQRAGLVTFQEKSVLDGRGALTLSVKPLCAKGARNCSERAEVWEKPEVLASYDQTVWYGFAMRLDDPVPQDDARYVMAQWKRQITPGAEGDYSPFLALRLFRGRLGVTVETDMIEVFPIGGAERPDGCLPGEALALNRRVARQTRALVALQTGSTRADYPAYFNACAPAIQVTHHAGLPPVRAGWIDFVFRSSPGPQGNGHIEIVANGLHVATIKGPVGHRGSGLGKKQYFKFGPYRAANKGAWSISYDDFRRGPRCADVIRNGQCPPE